MTDRFPLPTSPLMARNDPATSRESAERMRGSERLGVHQREALEAVRRWPARTAPELAALLSREPPWCAAGRDLTEYLRQRIGRRLSELRAAGLIYAAGKRDGCQVWRTARELPVEQGRLFEEGGDAGRD